MNIKLPNHNNLYLKHLQAFEFISKLEDVNTSDKLTFISIFTDIKVEVLEDYDIESIEELFGKIVQIGLTIPKKATIEKVISINGVDYEFIENLQNLPASWFTYVDRLKSENKLRSENIAAMCYIEKGMKYNQKDKDGKVINPIKKREDIFYNNFKAIDYLPLQGFFLTKFNEYTIAFSLLQEARMITTKEKQNTMLSKSGHHGITR
jgi:hypothetical protein